MLALILVIFLSITYAQTQTCPTYTAGSTSQTMGNANMQPGVYVSPWRDRAQCNGRVYAWNYCYYNSGNRQVAFGVFYPNGVGYHLRDGTYRFIRIEVPQDAGFTCDTLTLNKSDYFKIRSGDRVGACLEPNGSIGVLDVVRNNTQPGVLVWTSGGCTKENLAQSSTIYGMAAILQVYVDINVDECSAGSHNCSVHASCHDTVGGYGSFHCICNSGYTGNGTSCNNINECNAEKHNCSEQAVCTDIDGSFNCSCFDGYIGDGTTCKDINECTREMHNCSSNALCFNTNGAFMCTCNDGYTGLGVECNDMNECDSVTHKCHRNASCNNTDGSYSCTCHDGFTGDGVNCRGIDVCKDNMHNCGSNADCIITEEGYRCQCFTGYTGNGTYCEILPGDEESTRNNANSNNIIGLISGVTVAVIVATTAALVTGVACAMKLRKNSMSWRANGTIENMVYGQARERIEIDNVASDGADQQKSTTQNIKQGSSASLENYSAIDYYSTLNECSEAEGIYENIIKKVREGKGVVEEEIYYSPAGREDELYQQLNKQNIKSIPSSHIKKLGILGSGEFGTICKGQWVYDDKVLDVAIKILSDTSDETNKVKFLQEAAIMSQFRHPNVIKLYGVVNNGEQVMLIVELLVRGDLRQALGKMRSDPGQLHSANLPHTLLAYSRQIALGMSYLSGKGFVHRDIAARNILLSHNNICKISDFGMSRDLEDENYYMSKGGKIPVKWTAPEALAYKKYSTASDVWSYGCLLYEIWSVGHKPFEGYTNREVVQRVEEGHRLPPPPGCPEAIYHLMMDCWNPSSADRPTFQNIIQCLLRDDKSVLIIPVKEQATHSLAGVLGSVIEAGHGMYLNRQHCYLANN